MQRIMTILKNLSSMSTVCSKSLTMLSPYQSFNKTQLLQPCLPIINPVCGFKVKGKVRRRCKSCYFVVRDERLYVICPKSPRHKQMAMKAKPLNTYVLTHASQSPVRPW